MSLVKFLYAEEPEQMAAVNRIAKAVNLQQFSEEALQSMADNPAILVMLLLAPRLSCLPVGYIVAQITPPEAEIYDIGIMPVLQGQGFGSILLKKFYEVLRRDDVEDCFLEVRPSNRQAIGFYTRHGFSSKHIRKDYYSFPKEDAILLHLSLQNAPTGHFLS